MKEINDSSVIFYLKFCLTSFEEGLYDCVHRKRNKREEIWRKRNKKKLIEKEINEKVLREKKKFKEKRN